jgi:hypothetical protein
MLYIAAAFSLLLVAFAAIHLVGSRLPAQHLARMGCQYPIGCEVLWEILTDYTSAPQWRSSVVAVHRDTTTSREIWVENNGRRKVAYETIEQLPCKRLVRRIATPDLPFSGTWTFEIAPAQNGCLLQVTECGTVANPFFRFIARYLIGHERSLRQYLSELSAYVARRTQTSEKGNLTGTTINSEIS